MSVYTSCGIEPCSDSKIWVLITEKKGVRRMNVRERGGQRRKAEEWRDREKRGRARKEQDSCRVWL